MSFLNLLVSIVMVVSAVDAAPSRTSGKLCPKYVQDMCDSYCKQAIAEYGECSKTPSTAQTCVCGDGSAFLRQAMLCLRCGQSSRNDFGGALSTPLALCNIRITYNKNRSWNLMTMGDVATGTGAAVAEAKPTATALPGPMHIMNSELKRRDYFKHGGRVPEMHIKRKAPSDNTNYKSAQKLNRNHPALVQKAKAESHGKSTTQPAPVPSNYIPEIGVIAAGIA